MNEYSITPNQSLAFVEIEGKTDVIKIEQDKGNFLGLFKKWHVSSGQEIPFDPSLQHLIDNIKRLDLHTQIQVIKALESSDKINAKFKFHGAKQTLSNILHKLGQGCEWEDPGLEDGKYDAQYWKCVTRVPNQNGGFLLTYQLKKNKYPAVMRGDSPALEKVGNLISISPQLLNRLGVHIVNPSNPNKFPTDYNNSHEWHVTIPDQEAVMANFKAHYPDKKLIIQPSKGIAGHLEFAEAFLNGASCTGSTGVEWFHDFIFHVLPIIDKKIHWEKYDELTEKCRENGKPILKKLRSIDPSTLTEREKKCYFIAVIGLGALIDTLTSPFDLSTTFGCSKNFFSNYLMYSRLIFESKENPFDRSFDWGNYLRGLFQEEFGDINVDDFREEFDDFMYIRIMLS